LFNSIPVITLRHPDLHSHNVSASLLHHIGLTELIADSSEEYVEKAVQLSMDTRRLFEYRDQGAIHQKFQQWMNPARFMKEYEGAIEKIWEKHKN
jgi:predicted O-linked N-acetylglucosamine transferase (SPINDLY family)